MFIINIVRGFCMALADSVPGVSGGTVAFLLGFYDRFISALDDLFTGSMEKKKKAIGFLIQIAIGWVASFLLAVVVLTQIFDAHIYAVSSLFIGFILFAIPMVIQEEKKTLKGNLRWIFFVLIGIAVVVAITMLSPTGGTDAGFSMTEFSPMGALYLFLSGMAAISAMVLPGISGSTLLLIMGVYLPIMTAIRATMGMDLSAVPMLAAFALGICAGVVLFIKLLRYLLTHFRPQMIFLIVGLMLGSLYAVAMGPMTLDTPQPPLGLSSFQILFFLLGGVIIFALQGFKRIMEKKQVEPTGETK